MRRVVILASLAALPVAAHVRAQAPASPPAQAAAQTARPAPPRPSPFVPPEPIDPDEHEGWTSIFDGRTLDGWDGNPAVWRVVDGAITAVSTADRRVGSTHLIWRGGEPADFELKLEIRLDGDIHSGIAYRSYLDPGRGAAARRTGAGRAPAAGAGRGRGLQVPSDPRWTLYGPGFDFDADREMAGNVEERGTPRREIAWRGLIVRAEAGKRPRAIGGLGDPDVLEGLIKPDAWNQIHIVARGHVLTHIINGHVMAVLIDDDPAYFRSSGLVGIQIEQYGTGRVRVRDVWLKRAPGSEVDGPAAGR